MSDAAYKKLKKQKGEKFAQTIRNFHNGILEIPDLDLIVRHAGQEAEPLLPYLMCLLAANDDTPPPAPGDPFAFLDQAGYTAFHANTLEKQNSIRHYFQPNELLCTFNDKARYKDYYIVHAIKKDVNQISREDFKGREKRQDEYGTSVISIQMLKEGGFISIKNRYNHTVSGSDNTFSSNPDNIIDGLSAALKNHFNVEFSATKTELPEGYVQMGNQVFKYDREVNNIYYGDQAWTQNGTIHAVDRGAGDALFDGFLFDNKTKTLIKIDTNPSDSFADDFNRYYGGNPALQVKDGNLTLNGDNLIGAEKSRIKTLYLPALTVMSDHCLHKADKLERFEAPALTTMGDCCLYKTGALKQFESPSLTTMGDYCFSNTRTLTQFESPLLTTMGIRCFYRAHGLTRFNAPSLTTMGEGCLNSANKLVHFEAPSLIRMGDECLYSAVALAQFDAPSLTTIGNRCLHGVHALTQLEMPALTRMGFCCLYNADLLESFKAPALIAMGEHCFFSALSLTHLETPALINMGKGCFSHTRGVRPRSAVPAFTAR